MFVFFTFRQLLPPGFGFGYRGRCVGIQDPDPHYNQCGLRIHTTDLNLVEKHLIWSKNIYTGKD